MTAQNFINVVRFKLKSDCVDKYFEVIDKTSFEGMTQRYIAKTGDLYEHLQNLKKSKVTIYVSGMSAKSRGYDEKLLDGYSAEFVMPDVLIEESIKADSVLCY